MPKLREHGQGALYWVESRGMWRAVVDVGFDPASGKLLQKARMSNTKDGAVKKLNTMLWERETLGRVLDRSTPVAVLADRWLDDVTRRAKPRTLANYRSIVRTKTVPVLDERIVTDFTPAVVRRMHAAAHKSGVGDESVSGAHRTLVTLLKYARAERIITENVRW